MARYKSNRSKACDVGAKIRDVVKLRDFYRCIFCGTPNSIQIAHFVSRGAGGLGIEENLACACFSCHQNLDQSRHKARMLDQFENYLRRTYPFWDKEKLRYKKYGN